MIDREPEEMPEQVVEHIMFFMKVQDEASDFITDELPKLVSDDESFEKISRQMVYMREALRLATDAFQVEARSAVAFMRISKQGAEIIERLEKGDE